MVEKDKTSPKNENIDIKENIFPNGLALTLTIIPRNRPFSLTLTE